MRTRDSDGHRLAEDPVSELRDNSGSPSANDSSGCSKSPKSYVTGHLPGRARWLFPGAARLLNNSFAGTGASQARAGPGESWVGSLSSSHRRAALRFGHSLLASLFDTRPGNFAGCSARLFPAKSWRHPRVRVWLKPSRGRSWRCRNLDSVRGNAAIARRPWPSPDVAMLTRLIGKGSRTSSDRAAELRVTGLRHGRRRRVEMHPVLSRWR